MDERIRMNGGMYGMDGRNPYGSQGGYVMNQHGGGRGAYRRMRRNARRDMARGRYSMNRDMRRSDYMGDMARGDRNGYDMRGGMDGHHYPMQGQQGQGSTYYPIQAMGTFEGYYGMPNQDYARQDMGGYDMRNMPNNRNDFGYPMQYPYYPPMDFGYPVGDFGETLSEEELEEWKHKLMSQLDEQEKQMFSHEMLMQKVKQLGRPMEGFGEKEMCVATLMVYTDYKQDIGKNPDMAIRLAYDWLADKDVKVKGAEKLATYYDEIVLGGKDD